MSSEFAGERSLRKLVRKCSRGEYPDPLSSVLNCSASAGYQARDRTSLHQDGLGVPCGVRVEAVTGVTVVAGCYHCGTSRKRHVCELILKLTHSAPLNFTSRYCECC